MNRTAARKVVSSYLETPVVAILRRIGLSPNSVTLLGLVVAGASAYLLSIGNLWAGGVVLLASGMFDFFDGALARASGRASSFGALLDSVVDRLSEAAVLLGLLVYYLQQDSTEGAVLVYLALAGSIMVSYLRARAEGLGIECKVGIMTRPERVALLGIALLIGEWRTLAVLVALGVIAGLAFLTSAQRMLHSWAMLRDRE